MPLRAPRTALIVLAITVAFITAPAASGQPSKHPSRHMAPKRGAAQGIVTRGPGMKRSARARIRSSGGSARQEATRLGAMVGNRCEGRAAMQRKERQWVVLCSNGKTYLVEPPGPPAAGAPAVECALAANGRDPPCFVW
jgi:hypothetical protein